MSQLDPTTGTQFDSEGTISLLSDWLTAAVGRVRATTNLAMAEAKLAAYSLILMTFLACLAAILVAGGWGLLMAGGIHLLVTTGTPLWVALAGVGALHIVGAAVLWISALRVCRHMSFQVTRRQFSNSRTSDGRSKQEVATREMASPKKAG